MSEWSWVLTGGFAVLLIYYYALFKFFLREPEQPKVSSRTTPPENFTPARVAYLNQKEDVDHAYVHAFAATLIDLAIKGFIRIEPDEPDSDVTLMELKPFKLIRVRDDWTTLPPVEQKIRDIFKENQLELKDGWKKWASHSDEVRRTRLIAERFRAETKKGIIPDYINYNLDYVAPGILIAMITVAAFFFTSEVTFFINTLLGPFWFMSRDVTGIHALHFLMLMGLLFVNLWFMSKLNTYTPKGRKVKNELEGLSKFLSDKKGLEGMSVEEYVNLLPYAVALELTVEWAEKLQGTLPPSIHSWYEAAPGDSGAQSFGEFLAKDFHGRIRLYFGPRKHAG